MSAPWGSASRKWRRTPNILKHIQVVENEINKFSSGTLTKDSISYSTYGEERGQVEATRNALDNCKIFEIPDDVTTLLERTKAEIRRTHLPFPIMFLDASPTFKSIWDGSGGKWTKRERMHYYGFLLVELFGEHRELRYFAPSSMLTMRLPSNVEMPKTIRIYTIFSAPSSTEIGYLWADLYKDFSDIKGYVDGSSKRWAKESRLIKEFVMNCLDFINEPDVKYVERTRAYSSSSKRMRAGKGLKMPTMVIKITGELRKCLDRIRTGGHFSYSYKFWVRGHWRHFRSDRYIRSGLKGQRKWIMPYVKGEGLLIDKGYKLTRSADAEPTETEVVS